MKVGIVTSLLYGSGRAILSNLIKILEVACDDVYFISGKQNNSQNLEAYIKNMEASSAYFNMYFPLTTLIYEYFIQPIKTSINMIRSSRDVDTVIFLLGNITLTLPIVLAKLLKKQRIIILTGLHSNSMVKKRDLTFFEKIMAKIFRILENINFSLVDKIVGYTENNIYDLGLERYKHKFFNGARFVDLKNFKISKNIDERKKNIIAYIGRLSEEKGITNFIDAAAILSDRYNDLTFLIGGNGPLFNEVEKKVKNCNSNTTLIGWIEHDELPEYLNKLKLLVIPAYTETGPYIALEAMACGTPVLAMSVGFIPDIIEDGENGFILESNSPECIAQHIERILNYPYQNQVAKRARDLIEKNYTLQAAVERYKKILW